MITKKTYSLEFELSKEERKLYDEYGSAAKELAKSRNFSAAIELLDTILKEHPLCEFALVMKALYKFNQLNDEDHFSKIDFENFQISDLPLNKKVISSVRKKGEEIILLLDKALEINKENQTTKIIKEDVQENVIKPVNSLLKKIDQISQKANEEEQEILRYNLKCLGCEYSWDTKYAKIPAKCPSCNKKIYNSNNYVINTRYIKSASGCCGAGLIPTLILFFPFMTIIPSKRALLKIIDFHQNISSPKIRSLGFKCRYHLSCSSYGKNQINKNGAIKGGWRTILRLTQCTPF